MALLVYKDSGSLVQGTWQQNAS